MNNEFNEVRKFHQAFNHPVAEKPTSLSYERASKRYSWILEEINEFLEATQKCDIVEQADAMIDTIYFALGTLVEMGVQPDILFRIVQNANMSKLFPDGKPHYNDLGKVIKPDNWENPHLKLEQEIKKMLSNNEIDPTAPDYGINYQFDEVKKFHQAFNHPVAEKPTLLSYERAIKRYSWILEEINEFLDAVRNQDIVEQADAMIDTIYFALGTLVEMGVQPDILFGIVQNANMSKLFPDGKPHYSKDGKVIKPENWQDPHPKLELAIRKM